eukprot:Pompholyxophrys_punicea_v1_NODE_1145_length_911_cov_13.954439.p1 type:complete len:141 gc:universal NODE_1145_length_911_cov_13.954439:546-124(-)
MSDFFRPDPSSQLISSATEDNEEKDNSSGDELETPESSNPAHLLVIEEEISNHEHLVEEENPKSENLLEREVSIEKENSDLLEKEKETFVEKEKTYSNDSGLWATFPDANFIKHWVQKGPSTCQHHKDDRTSSARTYSRG